MTMMGFAMRLGMAILLGFLIGLERQLTGHSAGIRINVLICLGTCSFMLFPNINGTGDVGRLVAAIVSGVGFLCSGVMFKSDSSVRGLHTSATLWCTAAIGVLVSGGKLAYAAIAAGMLIMVNLILRPLVPHIRPILTTEESEKLYRISVTCADSAEIAIRAMLISKNTCRTLYLATLESGDSIGDRVEIQATYTSTGSNKSHVVEQLTGRILTHPAVTSAGWEIL